MDPIKWLVLVDPANYGKESIPFKFISIANELSSSSQADLL